jgi:dipeptidyl aminopeptidase/acylaminoacyl peptidase
MDYLSARPDLTQPRFGGLGVSYGAGLVLLAAAHDHRLAAVVSDSTYPSATPMFTQWNDIYMRIWPYHIPLAPLGAPAANVMLDGRLDDLAPLKQAPAVSPSALLLIHGAQDFNPLTSRAGTEAIYAAAHEPKAVWMAPRGEHASVLFADPVGYRDQVVAFFDRYLRGR